MNQLSDLDALARTIIELHIINQRLQHENAQLRKALECPDTADSPSTPSPAV